MSTPVVTPDPVLDNSYGQQPVEPRTKVAPPISRSFQLTDDFSSPELPAALQTTPPVAPETPPVPPVPPVTPELPPTPPVAATPLETPPTPPLAPDGQPPVKVFRVIDLNDGSGVQRFEAEGPDLATAYERLADKLTQAQEHGTRKIRELRERARAKPDRDIGVKPLHFAPRQTTDADLVKLKELQASDPVEAQRFLMELATGIKPEVLVNAVNDMQVQRIRNIADTAAVEFIADHLEDFDNTPASGKKVFDFLRGCTRPVNEGGYACKFCGKTHDPELLVTRNNLEYAFEQLTEGGANFAPATPRQAPAPIVAPPVPPPAPVAPPVPVVVAPVAPPTPPPVSTPAPPPPGVLSDRSGQRPPEPLAGLEGVNVAEIANLPIHEMRARIGKLMKR